MSFKKYGGLKFAATNNIVKSHFSNSDNPQISNYLGQQNSKIVSASHIDMSDNSICNVQCIYFNDGTAMCTGIPITSAMNWGDYLYWDSNVSKWAIGDTNITLGKDAGKIGQGASAVALGDSAGRDTQGPNSIAIGYKAGYENQLTNSIAIGYEAGKIDQSNNAIAIGYQAGIEKQGHNAIAIGQNTGYKQKEYSIAIGQNAGNYQPANSIEINASGVYITRAVGDPSNACYIAPIRDASGRSMLMYDGSTNELTYGNTINGSITSTSSITAASFVTSSDYRIKENVELLDDTFSVDNLKPVHYTNIVTNKHDIGFLAHEVQKEFPYLVSGEKDGPETQALNYQGLIGVLVKEIQEIKKRVLFLEKKT